MNVGIGTEAALFPEKEYIMEISFAVYKKADTVKSQDKMCTVYSFKFIRKKAYTSFSLHD
jgi:hypothetical protein